MYSSLAELGLSCCEGFSRCGVWRLLLPVASLAQHTVRCVGLSSYGTWAQQLPSQGSNLGPLHWELGVLTSGPPGKSMCSGFDGDVFSICPYCGIPRPWKQLFLFLGGSPEMQAVWSLLPLSLTRWEQTMCQSVLPGSPCILSRTSTSTDSVSPDSTNHGFKIFEGKKIPESSKNQDLNLPPANSYLYSTYIVSATVYMACMWY